MGASRELRLSFDVIADDYDFGRPTYPGELVHWALGSEPLTVLDIGAGTGKLTEVVIGAGHSVTALEPLSRMTAVLRRRLQGVPVVRGRAEEIPFASGSFDAVVVGQAFHWFDHRVALEEIARVVRRGGTLALFWNVYAGDAEWLPYPRVVPGQPVAAFEDHSAWGRVRHRTYAWNFAVNESKVLAFCRSHSSVACLPARARVAYSAEIAPRAAAVAEEGTLPLVTHVWRGVRS